MNELFEAEETNIPEFSVSSLSGTLKRTIEEQFGRIRVRGEIGRVSRPKSGHLYLDLKDDSAVLASIIWKGVASKMEIHPEEGMEVLVTGRLTTFSGQSKYQLIIEDMTPAGAGALMAMLEKRRQMFIAEGVFEAAHKRPLPFLPASIGVITSPSGAVIQDILHRLADRFPSHVLLWPVSVQGKQCAPSVVQAIEGFNDLKARPDILIVARGGGSLEDLWEFNDERVVRAVFASEIPMISAIGHETDTTLIDYVADRRAPTPSAAAEMAVPVRRELLHTTQSYGTRLEQAIYKHLHLTQERLQALSHRIPTPENLLQERVQRLDMLGQRLPKSLTTLIATKRYKFLEALQGLSPAHLQQSVSFHQQCLQTLSNRFTQSATSFITQKQQTLVSLARLLDSLSYKATLNRGYSVVRTDKNQLVTSKAKATAEMTVELHDGTIQVKKTTQIRRKQTDTPRQEVLI